jgi:hypothetical protein
MQRLTLALALCCITQLHAQSITLEKNTQTNLNLDIYPKTQALIQDSRILGPIKLNDSVTIVDISDKILPHSVHIFNAGDITELIVDKPLTYQQLLKQNVGSQISLIEKNHLDQEIRRSVTLLSVNNSTAIIDNQGSIETIPLHSKQWRIAFQNNAIKGLSSHAIRFKSKGKKHTNNILLSYLSSDIYWTMNYILALNTKEQKLQLKGLASITNNTATHFNNAKISLGADQPKPTKKRSKATASANTAFYKLLQRTSLPPGQQTLIPIAQATDIDAKVNYRFTSYITRQPNKRLAPQHPNSYLSFLNSAKHQLGKTLPAGKAKIFIHADSQDFQLFGEGDLAHSEAGERIEISMGKAVDFSITQRATGRQSTFDGSLASSQFILKNSSAQSRTLTLSIRFNHPSQIISSTYPVSNKQPLSARWNITVRANSTHVFDLNVRLKHPR